MIDRAARWVFGYGSLVWRPAFEYVDRRPGFIRGFARRFWQGSPDHRGVPHAPGRVVTLVRDPDPHVVCWGMAYRVADEAWERVLRILDERESGGFERLDVEVAFAGAEHRPSRALVYVASQGNPNFLGPAPLDAIAAQVRQARGKSGSNLEYVLQLADALRALGADDEHVFELAAALGDGSTRDGS